eukprot:gene5209-8821_t
MSSKTEEKKSTFTEEYETSKKDKTFQEETKKLIEESKTTLQKDKKQLHKVIEGLLNLEKKTRLGADNDSTSLILTEVVRFCAECEDWKFLNENISILSKKRSQSKMALSKMVQTGMNYIDSTPDKPTKVELLNTLYEVTEGKIYVEVERSRLARMKSKILEEEGKLVEASELLQEVQIETIGSLEAAEKIEFILNHFRITLDSKDFVRAYIIARKITERSLAQPEHQDLKIQYQRLMIRYYTESKDYINIAKAHMSIYQTPKIKESESDWKDEIEHIVLYLTLSTYNHEVSDLMNRIFSDRKLEECPLVYELLKTFVSFELINLTIFEGKFKNQLLSHGVFKAEVSRYDDLKNRVVENNIRVISKYYSRIRMKRLSNILHLTEEQAEKFICDMVIEKTISAKIDRIEGVVKFKQPKESNDVLNSWSNDTGNLLSLVEKSVHFINKELVQKEVSSK